MVVYADGTFLIEPTPIFIWFFVLSSIFIFSHSTWVSALVFTLDFLSLPQLINLPTQKVILEQPCIMTNVERLVGTNDFNLIEAPVSWRAYMICGFASFGGWSLFHMIMTAL